MHSIYTFFCQVINLNNDFLLRSETCRKKYHREFEEGFEWEGDSYLYLTISQQFEHTLQITLYQY